MMIRLHKNATTTPAKRALIQASSLPVAHFRFAGGRVEQGVIGKIDHSLGHLAPHLTAFQGHAQRLPLEAPHTHDGIDLVRIRPGRRVVTHGLAQAQGRTHRLALPGGLKKSVVKRPAQRGLGDQLPTLQGYTKLPFRVMLSQVSGCRMKSLLTQPRRNSKMFEAVTPNQMINIALQSAILRELTPREKAARDWKLAAGLDKRADQYRKEGNETMARICASRALAAANRAAGIK